MMPTDEQPESDGNVTFSGLEECDQLVQAFRDFLISEVSKPNPTPLHSIVAEFSRRVTFISQHVGMQLNDDQAYSLLSRLNDPLMAQLAFDSINSKAGHQRLLDYLAKHPFPHYEADPVHSDRIVRIEEDGTRTSGRFVNRQFVVIENE
jgi:hypothetical protein